MMKIMLLFLENLKPLNKNPSKFTHVHLENFKSLHKAYL